MRKILKYSAAALACFAMLLVSYSFIKSTYANGMHDYVKDIGTEVEMKREDLLKNSVFHEGITVNNIPIGGLTHDEAVKLLSKEESRMVRDVRFIVEYEDGKKLLITNEYFDFTYNTEDILSDAIMIANEGSLESIQQQIDDLKENGKDYTITYSAAPKNDMISEAVYELAERLNVDPVNAKVVVDKNSVYNGTDRFKYTEGKNGYRVKADKAVDEILSRAKTGDYGTVVLEGEIIEPEIKISDIKGKIVRRSHFESSYASYPYNYPDRVFNVDKACRLVNGTVLSPGQVFSANKTLGDRTYELGWKAAPGFIDGGARSVDSPGGGVCHVSSTLYNAVIKSDLKIVYRINHSSHVGYVPWGQDATIDTGRIDFKFSNNTKNDIYIFMWVDTHKKKVCCEIWGTPFPSTFDSIDFYAELVETIEPTPREYFVDRSLAHGHWYINNSAKTGYKYESYKQYLKKGVPVGDPVRVATSVYRMHPQRIAVWAGFDPNVDILDPALREEPPVPES